MGAGQFASVFDGALHLVEGDAKYLPHGRATQASPGAAHHLRRFERWQQHDVVPSRKKVSEFFVKLSYLLPRVATDRLCLLLQCCLIPNLKIVNPLAVELQPRVVLRHAENQLGRASTRKL